MKIKNLESDRKQRIETLRETIRGCEREIRRLEENPDTCEEGIPGDPGSVLLEQGVYEHMMQRIEDTLNWCHILILKILRWMKTEEMQTAFISLMENIRIILANQKIRCI